MRKTPLLYPPRIGSPLTPDLSTVPNAPGRSGVVVQNNVFYTSSIDPGLVGLSAQIMYDAGCAADALANGYKLPFLILCHGYEQDIGFITDALRRRGADHGFFIIAVNMRGRNVDPGFPDDSCRELQDIVDAVFAAALLYPAVADLLRVHAIGYSGGAANVLALVAKYVGWILTANVFFGWGDYGYSAVLGHSLWASGTAQAVVEARIGPRSDLQPYLARLVLQNIARAIQQTTGELWMFWDSQDDIGICLRDVRDQLLAQLAPASRWYANESGPGDPMRWLHGYPETSPDLIPLENLIYRRRDVARTGAATSGLTTVTGHMVHAGGFSLWTADTGSPDPRLDPAGGQRHVVGLTFNVPARHFTVVPMSGPCAVQVAIGGSAVVKNVSGTTVFDVP